MAKLGRTKQETKERRIGPPPGTVAMEGHFVPRRKLNGFGLVTGLYTPSGFVLRQAHFAPFLPLGRRRAKRTGDCAFSPWTKCVFVSIRNGTFIEGKGVRAISNFS